MLPTRTRARGPRTWGGSDGGGGGSDGPPSSLARRARAGQGSSSVEADRSAGGGGRGPAQHSAVDVLLLDVKGQEGEGCFINGLVVYKVNTGVAAAPSTT